LIVNERKEKYQGNEKIGFLGTIIKCPVQQHGVINKQPKNLGELNNIVKKTGINLIHILQKRLKDLHSSGSGYLLHANLMMTIIFPKKRDKKVQDIEVNDIWSFLCIEEIKDLGVKLGIWDIVNGNVCQRLKHDKTVSEQNINVSIFRPMYSV